MSRKLGATLQRHEPKLKSPNKFKRRFPITNSFEMWSFLEMKQAER